MQAQAATIAWPSTNRGPPAASPASGLRSKATTFHFTDSLGEPRDAEENIHTSFCRPPSEPRSHGRQSLII